MRLLKASKIELVEFSPNRVPPYAILSHRWQEDEVLLADISHPINDAKLASYKKTESVCKQAAADRLEYVWVDTCCIDKTSSAELSEAINSMYSWYRQAEKCYAYLSDVVAEAETDQRHSSLARSEWFKRGWTLQELLAPTDVIFFSRDWVEIGTKSTLSEILSNISGIDKEILAQSQPARSASIAKRMSWASERVTTRPEDIAYSLMGIFAVNMPILYGEGGEKAFQRLQEEIMKQSDDHSLFAWRDFSTSPGSHCGLLARHPSAFALSKDILPYDDWEPRRPFSMTNMGLCIDLPMFRHDPFKNDDYAAVLACATPPHYKNNSFVTIFLQQLAGRQFVRIDPQKLGSTCCPRSYAGETIYVRQAANGPETQGLLPQHLLQLRRGPTRYSYRVDMLIYPCVIGEVDVAAPVEVSVSSELERVRPPLTERPLAFAIAKRAKQLALAIIFERTRDQTRFVVLLGSMTNFHLGSNVVDLKKAGEWEVSWEDAQGMFEPEDLGTFMRATEDIVCVTAEVIIHNRAKYYLIDIEIVESRQYNRQR